MTTSRRTLDREIFALAVPTFATLVSEPLLLLADSAIVGHLGTDQLAGLGIAANVLGILIGLSIFLAYGTTGSVARRLGAGDRGGALATGFDGMVLAVLIGVGLSALLQAVLVPVVGLYDVSPAVADQAVAYLRIAAFGLPGVLLTLASTGVLRGLQDTRTPLYVVIVTNLTNIGLNLALVYGLGLGIAGSALGTLLAQVAAAVVLATVVVRGMRHAGVRLGFHPAGVLGAARTGVWLVLRTAALQAGITLTTVVAAGFGAVALAAHQVSVSIWTLLAFALDAIAIAGQAIIGRALGAGNIGLGRSMTRRMIGWGVVFGIVFGLLIALTSPLYAGLFSPDPRVQALLPNVLVVMALATPIAGVVFVLDGVLIGAGDGRYLALASLIALIAYVPAALAVQRSDAGLVWLWVAYGWYITARMLTLLWRIRGNAWLRTGAAP
ncbi:MAG TPA: MATE family efflux transporter [Microlunatus sp.]|nr:MATE family efflux transporter [Microlunatus sp.]